MSGKELLCPTCGSGNKTVEIEAILQNPDLGVTVKGRTGFKTAETKVKYGQSKGSKLQARKVLSIDRSDPKVTKKQHHVEEATEAGNYETVHHHEDIFPAKRRPQK